MSWYGEYMAVYKALFYIRTHVSLRTRILVDHKASADIFSGITTCTMAKLAGRNNMAGLPIWSAIRNLERQRDRSTKIVWVEAHVGNFGNNFADHLAGLYGSKARTTTLPFVCPLDPKRHSIKTILTHDNKIVIQETPRKLVNIINKVTKNIAGLQKLTRLGVPEDNDWTNTFRLVNNSIKILDANTGNRALSHRRGQAIKKLTGTLPTQQILKRNKNELYCDGLCRLCNLEEETNIHMWICTSNHQLQNRKLILDNFKLSVAKLIKPPPTLKQWAAEVLEHIPCLANSPLTDGIIPPIRYIFPPGLFPENRLKLQEISRQTQDITIAQLAGGFSPTSLQETILIMATLCHEVKFKDKNIIFDPKQVKRDFQSVLKALYRDFHEYWLERCTVTITWEKENNITQAQKRQKKQPSTRKPSPSATPRKSNKRGKGVSRIIAKRTQQEPSTAKAMSFALRKPTEDNHNKFYYDYYSKNTVCKKI